ncbi:MAG: hypothetical protein IJF44_06035 [Clostridia bacterium]|nr:hypothetical protein [Clostridia bacterium]
MKRILRNVVSVLLLLCLAFSIVACGEEGVLGEGPLYTLEEVYEAGEIDRKDLLNIAYYGGDAKYNSDEIDEDFVPIEKGELSEEISLEIREYLAEKERTDEKHPHPETKAEDFEITSYYGCYNGYYAFMYDNLNTVEPAVIEEYFEEIDGVTFRYTSSHRIQMWKNNK